MTRVALAGLAAFAVAGCFGSCGGGRPATSKKPVPERSSTAGDDLLAAMPAGADLLIEIDLDRLRRNPVVGEVAGQLLAAQSAADRFEVASLDGIDLIVICSYAIGTARAVSLTVARGEGVKGWKRGHRIDERTVALAPNTMLDRLVRVAKKREKSLAQDTAFLRLRAASMPSRAPAATLRLSARLGFDARVRLSSMFDLDQVPASFTVWGDVIDDLALVGYLGGTSVEQTRALARVARGWRDRLARDPLLRRLFLHYLVRRIDVQPKDTVVRMVWVIGPEHLQRAVARIRAATQKSSEANR